MVPAHMEFIIKWGREVLIKSSLTHTLSLSLPLSFRDTHTHMKLDLGQMFWKKSRQGSENPLGSI